MTQQTFIILLSIHLIISFAYSLMIIFRRSSLTPAVIPMILFIPVFGFLSAGIADLVNQFKHRLGNTAPIETVKLEEDIYWKSIRKETESGNIVPLEEALIINDRQTRKKLILEMLLDDPMKNIDILLLARENNDVDTAHYANTTIAKIQRDFQLQVQQLSAQHELEPQNSKILDTYIETLGKFIDSNLSEAYLLHRQRVIYGSLLNKKIELDGWSKKLLQKKIRNALALKDINDAISANKIMHTHFPDDESTWINELQICTASHDAARLQDTIKDIQSTPIKWSNAGKEQVSTWIEVQG